jgi:hypothetical protein
VLAGSSNDPDDYELRCSNHNDYEGRLYFGRRRRKGKDDGEVRERPASYRARSFSAELVPEQTAGRRWQPPPVPDPLKTRGHRPLFSSRLLRR